MKRLLLVASIALLSGCGGPPSETITKCDEWKHDIILYPMNQCTGDQCIVTLIPLDDYTCVKSHVEHNPAYDEWVVKQKK